MKECICACGNANIVYIRLKSSYPSVLCSGVYIANTIYIHFSACASIGTIQSDCW